MNDCPRTLMSATEVAASLGVSEMTVRRLATTELPVCRMGRLVRFRVEDVQKFAESRMSRREAVA